MSVKGTIDLEKLKLGVKSKHTFHHVYPPRMHALLLES
jgi:hypothetical protein